MHTHTHTHIMYSTNSLNFRYMLSNLVVTLEQASKADGHTPKTRLSSMSKMSTL